MMADDKNFYYLMLDLPEDITSPDCYQLLGLKRFEDDLDIIKDATLDANKKLLAWQNSDYHRECDQLMDEVVKAREVLIDTKRKAKYDERLRQRLGIEEFPDASEEPEEKIALAPVPPSRAELRRRAEQREAEEAALKSKKLLIMWGLGGVAAVVVMIGVTIGVLSRPPSSPKPLTVMIKRVGSNSTNADSVEFDVAFSDTVKNVDFRDFQLNLSGVTADPLEAEDVTDASDMDLKTFRVTVRNVDGDGTLGLDVASSAAIVDNADKTLTPTSTTSEEYSIDNTAPGVAMTSPEAGAFYNNENWPEEITGTASESDGVSSISKVQVAFRRNSTGKYWNGTDAFDRDTAIPLDATGTTSWSFAFADELFPEDGEYEIGTSAVDTTGNVGSMVSATLTWDTAAPTVVSVDSEDSKPTNAAEIDYVVTFSEPVSGVDVRDFSLTHDQGGLRSSVQNVSGNGSRYTVTVTIGFFGGTLRLDVLNDGTIEDRAGNPLGGGFTTAALVPVGPFLPVVPFDLQEAQLAQESWANHLGTDFTLTNSIRMKLVLIPPGEFVMGSPEGERYRKGDELQHRIRITKPFYLQTTEVTQGQWEALMGTKPWSRMDYRKAGGREYAVKEGQEYAATHVSWEDAQEFCQRLSEKESITYRLPTEAEWEYACRAGTTTAYCFGDDRSQLGQYAWFGGWTTRAGDAPVTEVGLKKANAFGLYDMHGNVSESCQDWYDEDYYANSPPSDPPGPAGGSLRVSRGRHGRGGGETSAVCRSASRGSFAPDDRDVRLGFRVVHRPGR